MSQIQQQKAAVAADNFMQSVAGSNVVSVTSRFCEDYGWHVVVRLDTTPFAYNKRYDDVPFCYYVAKD